MLLGAKRIHNGHGWLPEGSVIEISGNGTVVNIYDSTPDGAVVEHYDGIICPGFINAHCHLELSHMKGVIAEHTGLIPFLQQVMFVRTNFTQEQKKQARQQAFEAMLANGVVAVGDISNTTDTIDLRDTGNMHFHSFIEAIGFNSAPDKQFGYAKDCYEQFAKQSVERMMLRQSITPHAPYSVSEQLFKLIDRFDEDAIVSIHNQESEAENQFYEHKEGAVRTLLNNLGIDDAFFIASGQTSLQTYMQWLSPQHPLLLVHNTFTTQEDIENVQLKFEKVYWCLCPNANLYIENRLPDIDMLCKSANNICIGTDSLSSNHQLSVLAELQTIHKHSPHISWEQLLTWGTYNGAVALQMEHETGSIEPGKKPGIVLIQNIDTKPRVSVLKH